VVVDVGHAVRLKNLVVVSTKETGIPNLNGVAKVLRNLAEESIEP